MKIKFIILKFIILILYIIIFKKIWINNNNIHVQHIIKNSITYWNYIYLNNIISN